jgi:hypothetical protein
LLGLQGIETSMLDPHTFGSDTLSVVFVDILNAREEPLRKKVCRLMYAFEHKMICLKDVKDSRQYFYQLLYSAYKRKVLNLCGNDDELRTFTLNFLCKLYRKNFV